MTGLIVGWAAGSQFGTGETDWQEEGGHTCTWIQNKMTNRKGQIHKGGEAADSIQNEK